MYRVLSVRNDILQQMDHEIRVDGFLFADDLVKHIVMKRRSDSIQVLCSQVIKDNGN